MIHPCEFNPRPSMPQSLLARFVLFQAVPVINARGAGLYRLFRAK